MSQKDRTELRRIVKARFAILQSQLRTRQQELQHTLREQVEAEYASEIERAQKKSQKILEKARKLEDEARELEQEMRGIGIS
ncbi:hypothetical protein, partial [Ferruginibacter sp.]|uniref:hypothetical protein n=1 Tax=Ferruginibacter sp. TaxID=1940288 RepID=UPI00265AB03E